MLYDSQERIVCHFLLWNQVLLMKYIQTILQYYSNADYDIYDSNKFISQDNEDHICTGILVKFLIYIAHCGDLV